MNPTHNTNLGAGAQNPLVGTQINAGTGATGLLPNQIPHSTLQQHASQLQGGVYQPSGNIIDQGVQGITHGMAGLSTGPQQTQVVHATHTVQQVPFGTGVPTGIHTGIPTGVQTGIATGGPALGVEGIAGHSNVLASNLGTQGNIVGAPLGTHTGLVQTNVTPTHSVPGNTTAQGQFIFRPLEGKFVKDNDLIGKQDPYVKIKLGWHTGKTAVAQGAGLTAAWTDAITLPRKHNETFAKLKIKDKDRLRKDDRLGVVKLNLDEVVQRGRLAQWYPITNRKGEPAGEILVDTEYAPLFIH